MGSQEANPWGLANAFTSVLLPKFAIETQNLPAVDRGCQRGRSTSA